MFINDYIYLENGNKWNVSKPFLREHQQQLLLYINYTNYRKPNVRSSKLTITSMIYNYSYIGYVFRL